MIKLSTTNTKRQLAIHGWAGLVFGFLLYLIVLTGAVVVFTTELSQWSVSGQVHSDPISYLAEDTPNKPSAAHSVHKSVNKLAQYTPDIYHHKIEIRTTYQGYLRVAFMADKDSITQPDQPRMIQFLINPIDLKILEVRQDNTFIDSTASSWVRFIRDIHTDLYLPYSISRYIVGILAMILLITIISGVLLHRHLIKELFLTPRQSNRNNKKNNPVLAQRDKHNLSGTWSLPFAFLLAFTGACICFDTNIGLPVAVVTAFDGDVEKATAALLSDPDVNEVSLFDNSQSDGSQIYNLDKIISNASKQVTIAPKNIDIMGYGTGQVLVQTHHHYAHLDNDMSMHHLLFNGNTGEFIRETAQVGHQPTISSKAFRLLYTLHFGDFSGWLSKTLWFGLSLLLCHVIISGFKLWFERRIKEPSWQQLYMSVPILSYGAPISLVFAGFGYFIVYSGGSELTELHAIWAGFGIGWLVSLAGLVVCFIINRRQPFLPKFGYSMWFVKQYLRLVLTTVCLLMPLVRWLVSYQGWSNLMASDNQMVVVIDVFFIMIAIITFIRLLADDSPQVYRPKQKQSSKTAKLAKTANQEHFAKKDNDKGANTDKSSNLPNVTHMPYPDKG